MLHLHLNECESTQIVAEKLLQEGNDSVLVSCERQNAGVGRRERPWFSADKCLALSFNIKPCEVPTLTSLELGILTKEFIQNKFNANVLLKWPNDIYTAEGGKCGGILIQGRTGSFIAGIGINLFHGGDIPSSIEGKFQTLLRKGPAEDLKEISAELCDYIGKNRLSPQGIRELWPKSCIHLNAEVRAEEDGKIILGVFKGIGPMGQALLETESGVVEIYNATLNINP